MDEYQAACQAYRSTPMISSQVDVDKYWKENSTSTPPVVTVTPEEYVKFSRSPSMPMRKSKR